MLTPDQATAIVRKEFPEGRIQKRVVYNDLYLFQIFTDDPLEGDQDPFYSVNRNTGEFLEFSILTDGDIVEVSELFMAAKAS